MPDRMRSASDYSAEELEAVKTVCLTIATVLGDEVMNKHVVIIGGLVPTLLCPESMLADGVERHVGTMDVDLGFSLAILNDNLYQEIASSLRASGFVPDTNERGRDKPQSWKHEQFSNIVVDFLMPEIEGEAGFSKWLESDFAPIRGQAVHLAFESTPIQVKLSGTIIDGTKVARRIQVCASGPFIILKAIAHQNRDKPKDAYDLWFMLNNYEDGPVSVAKSIVAHIDDAAVQDALKVLSDEFTDIDSLGPARVCKFLDRIGDDDLKADVVTSVELFLGQFKSQ